MVVSKNSDQHIDMTKNHSIYLRNTMIYEFWYGTNEYHIHGITFTW